MEILLIYPCKLHIKCVLACCPSCCIVFKEGQEEYCVVSTKHCLLSLIAPIMRAVTEKADNTAITSTKEMKANVKKANERQSRRIMRQGEQ